MIGFIIISALLLCGVITLLAILFMRPSEVPISDKSIDLSAVLPIQTITDSVIVNGSGDLTIGYRLFLPEVFTLSQEDAKYIHERLEGLFKMLPPATVVHQQCFYYVSQYKNNDFSVNPLKAESIKHFNNKQIINCYTNLYITFANTDLKKGVQKKLLIHRCLKSSIILLNSPIRTMKKGYQRLNRKS